MKTPQIEAPSLAHKIGIQSLFLKREDLHPYGSHKGRSIPHMITHYGKQGMSSFVISSSGNAALAAIHAIADHNRNNSKTPYTLTVYIGMHIPETKKQALKHANTDPTYIHIEQVDKPKQAAFQQGKKEETIFLRQSTDDEALIGYHELAEELTHIPDLFAVFVGTSSGTTAQGIGAYMMQHNLPVAMHIAQTSVCHPIAAALDKKSEEEEETSLAGAIVDRVAHRKQAVIDIITQTHGDAWIISNQEIRDAMGLVKETTDIGISPNSALSIAAIRQAVKHGVAFDGPVVCLICGA